MAAPTSTYVDYATGNDYKGASFTDGAYTSATKTLVKVGAFAASQVNHWLYLMSNDGGSIVAGYYKIADITGAPNAVILATDAGAGVDDDAAKCTQAAGTTALPWRSIQGALDLITRDATNGDQVNVKAGTAQVNAAALTLARYGTPAAGVPLIIRGYTTAANDGGIGEIDCGGATMFAATSYTWVFLGWLEIHTFGDNNGINMSSATTFGMVNCEVHKGASSPSDKMLVYGRTTQFVIGCYIHYVGAGTSWGVRAVTYVIGCTIKTAVRGIYEANFALNNLVINCDNGIYVPVNGLVIGNTVYHSGASAVVGILLQASSPVIAFNNIVEGYSGAGDVGMSGTGDVFAVGYNAFYNNTTPKSLGDIYFDLTASDVALAASPFVDAANGNFALLTSVAGAIDGAFPGAWPGLATTVDHADIGAVQNGAGSGGGGGAGSFWLVMRRRHG